MYDRICNRGINRVSDNCDRQLAKLHLGMYQEGWLACLTELDIPADHLAWSKAAPEMELSNSPKPYLPLVLPGFNEEEYMNQLAKEEQSC